MFQKYYFPCNKSFLVLRDHHFLTLFPLYSMAGEDSVEEMVVLGKMGLSLEGPVPEGYMVSFVR